MCIKLNSLFDREMNMLHLLSVKARY